jgi:hypothetical protein
VTWSVEITVRHDDRVAQSYTIRQTTKPFCEVVQSEVVSTKLVRQAFECRNLWEALSFVRHKVVVGY